MTALAIAAAAALGVVVFVAVLVGVSAHRNPPMINGRPVPMTKLGRPRLPLRTHRASEDYRR